MSFRRRLLLYALWTSVECKFKNSASKSRSLSCKINDVCVLALQLKKIIVKTFLNRFSLTKLFKKAMSSASVKVVGNLDVLVAFVVGTGVVVVSGARVVVEVLVVEAFLIKSFIGPKVGDCLFM